MKTKPLVLLLAFSSLFFAILLPPEAYPNGKLAVVLCATFAFLSALSENRIPRMFLMAGIGIFGVLLLHTLTISIDQYRSLDTISSLWAYYCLIGFFMYCSAGYEKYLAGVMVGLSLIVSLYGLYQYFWGFDAIAKFVFYSGSDQVIKAPALGIIAERRVSSTLALPGTLWGFLVCALPFHAMLWRRRLSLDVMLAISAALLLATGFLTRSFGFLLGLLVLIIGVVWTRNRRIVWNRVTPVILLLAIIGGSFYSTRHNIIAGSNPAGLRFLNWVSAWNIFAVHPLGTGLNTFGVIYPEYMQPAANETQYVHNTFLQLLSELGYPLLAAIVILLIVYANALKGNIRWGRPESFWLLMALIVWITHNMIDIDVYFPSVGVVGAVIIGALFAREESGAFSVPKPVLATVGIFSFVIMAFAGSVCIATELQHRAQIELENKKLTTALDTLSVARRICPINSSLDHDAGEIALQLYQMTRKPEYVTTAIEAFRHAVALSPEKAGSHIGYALSLSSANRMNEAIHEIKIAQMLYPGSSYTQSIARLMAQRIQ